MKLLSEAEKVLDDDLGNIPLLFYSFHNIVSSKLKGWEENVMDRASIALRQQGRLRT